MITALSLAATALVLPTSAGGPGSDQERAFTSVDVPGAPTTAGAYLELSVEPPIVTTGALVTLHIAYHNIGLPYTRILISPTGLITFEPALTMPCKYDQHPNGCTAITLRTLAPGVAAFNAGATGEVWDETCQCWYWSVAGDNGPVNIIIAESIWRLLLPLIYRN
jgi:hypothetical protein